MKQNEFLRGKPSNGNREQLEAALNKLGAIIIIIFGMWLSTQRFAKSVLYDPSWTGYPFYVFRWEAFGIEAYPLYYPWLYPWWCLSYWGKTPIHPYLSAALPPLIITSSISVVLYTIITYFRGFKQRAENVFGTARWARRKDLKKAGLLGKKGGVIIGQLFNAKVTSKLNEKSNSESLHLKKPSHIIVQPGIYNILLAAPTRSGKGVSSVIPTLLSYPGSVIVLDFKGENFTLTSGFRAKFSKIYRYAPVGETGHHFNPLMEIRGGKDAYSDANLLADILTTPATGKAKGDATSEHFRIAAMEFLTGVILHCLCSDWPDKSLPGCSKFLAQTNPEKPEDPTHIYQIMLDSVHATEEVHQLVHEAAGNQMKRPDREGASVLSTVNNALAVFKDSHIKENSSESEFFLDEFETSSKPISLYLTVPNSDRDRVAPLIRMFIILLSRRFSSGETSATDRKLKISLLFVLDEFDKLGKYDELHTNMGIHNGYGIHYFLIIQSPNQLSDIYGKDHSFLAHCRNTILFAPGEIESGKIMSEIIGRESIWKANTSNSGSRFSVGLDSLSISGQEQERSLINADEVMKLPPDQFILLSQGKPAYIGKKCVYYEDLRFQKRLLPAAFTTREAAIEICSSNLMRREGPHWFSLSEAALALGDEERVIDPARISWGTKPSSEDADTEESENPPDDDGAEEEPLSPDSDGMEIY